MLSLALPFFFRLELEADRNHLERTKRAMEEEARQARREADLLSAAAAILVRPGVRGEGLFGLRGRTRPA